eukprot:scaffold180512_cov44-Attheya_sp.AAC.1
MVISSSSNTLIYTFCSSLSKSFYVACEGPKLQQYCQEHKQIHPTLMQSMNWQACKGAARLLGVGLRFWKTKHVTGIFANGEWMHRWKFWTHSNCPRCGQPDKDAYHIIQCPEVTPLWTKAIELLQVWMEKSLAPPDVCAVILEQLHACCTSSPLRVQPEQCPPDLVEAVAVQSSIGW